MFRGIVSFCLIGGLLAHAADALACSPSPSNYLVPTGLLTDVSRPVARDAGIYFSTEARSMFVPDPAFAVEVKDASSGEVVVGSLHSLPVWLGADVLAWVPQQPLAANATYELLVRPLPPKPREVPPEKDVDTMKYPPVNELRASFTTGSELLPKLELEAAPRVSLRAATQVPYRCEGLCGLMSGPCDATRVLLADVELPAVMGGAEEQGYELTAIVRTAGIPKHLEANEREYVELVDARDPRLFTFEVMESPEPNQVCVELTIRDLAQQSVSKKPVCLEAEQVAAAIRDERRVKACAAVTPGEARGPHASCSLLLGVLLAFRRRLFLPSRTKHKNGLQRRAVVEETSGDGTVSQ
jgi:hypothetical protein